MSGFTDSLYLNSPIWLQQVMVALYGYHWHRRRFGGSFSAQVQEYRQRDRWTAEQFRDLQEVKLAQVLESAWRSPYYNQVFQAASIQRDLPPFEALNKIPFLSKATLRQKPKDLLTQVPPKDSVVFRTSGTTGTPTEVYYTRDFHTLELAIPAARNFGWAGIDYRARRVMFGVRKVCHFEQNKPPFWRFSPAEDMAYASIYHLSQKFIPYYLDFFRKFQPEVIMGYPSSLRTIARYALEHNDLPTPAKGVFTTSETVESQDRELIEAAWQCKIYDRYGAVEFCLFACQCEHGNYHVSPEAGIIEIVDSQGQPTPLGAMGEVICTGLNNTLQPLIRYRIGDVARWAVDQHCPCGREMPVLEAIEGRWEDICFTPDGRELLRFSPVVKTVDTIHEAQIIQEAIDRFVIRIVPDEGFREVDIHCLKQNMQNHVGDVDVIIELVDHIERTSSGKFKAVICRLSPETKSALRKISK